MAARLSENGRYRVLLLEAGPEDSAFWIKVPMGYPMLFTNPKVNWMFESEPEPELRNRRMYQPRGKVLGGTSSINGMLYIRGNHRDYQTWRQMGNEGWDWEDVLPYFRKAEDQTRGESEYHGVGGPLTVSDAPLKHKLSDAIVDAAVQAGLPRNPDFNGPSQEGAGFFQTTTRNRRRWNTSQAYLKPARSRSNLKVITNAHTTKVLTKDGRAVGIEFRTPSGIQTAMASREVIVCGGAFGSPHLLQLSGIGPAQHLADQGIDVVRDLPGVGSNLRDHFYASLMFRCPKPITINDLANNPLRRVWAGMQYVFLKQGPLSGNGIYAGIFGRSDPSKEQPDIQINTNLWTVASRDKSGMKPHPFPGFTMSPVHLAPQSLGSVRLRSSDPFADPEIRMNFFRVPSDITAMINGVRLVRTIASQDALKPFNSGEVSTGKDSHTDDEIEGWLRETAIANLHPVGSCRMGHDPMAVVDPQLRVHGVRGLRVVDASVMPALPSGNTNAPTIMIAERASDMVLEEARRFSPAEAA